MKKIIYIVTFLMSFSLTAQEDSIEYLQNLVGTWKWENGNDIFEVEMFVQDGFVQGHNKILEINSTSGTLPTLLHDSNVLINPSLNFYYGPAFFLSTLDGEFFSGQIDDNFLWSQGTHFRKFGSLRITIQPTPCLGCPTTARWQVENEPGIIIEGKTPLNYSIPTDIILTKQ